MIEVEAGKNHIKVSGHAGAGPPGHDIVCAGVSALTETLVRSIEALTDDKIQYGISPGRADIEFRDLSEKSKTLADSFFIGICKMAEAYPDNVRIV